MSLLDSDATADEKNRVFLQFMSEGKSMFKKYQVLFLKGISIPKTYEDLLKPTEQSNFSSITWQSAPPSTNNFSLMSYSLTQDEDQRHALDITTHLTNAVLGWMSN